MSLRRGGGIFAVALETAFHLFIGEAVFKGGVEALGEIIDRYAVPVQVGEICGEDLEEC